MDREVQSFDDWLFPQTYHLAAAFFFLFVLQELASALDNALLSAYFHAPTLIDSILNAAY
jgi:hypothetical protein